jgi:thioredoxin 1
MNEFNKIISQDKPTLVDVFATWCGPCKMMHPILEDIKRRVGDRATILKVDIDKNEALAAQYGIQSVPTLMIFKRGQLVWREPGVHSADDMLLVLERFM